MKNGKTRKIFLITISSIILTFLIVGIQKIEIKKIKLLRHLELDKSKVEKICKKGPEKVYQYYTNVDYILEPENKERYQNKYINILLEIIEGNFDNIITYAFRLIPFVAFIAFGFLSIFGWIFYCVCCCCPCCCCKQSAKNQHLCRFISLIASLSLFGIIIALSTYGFIGLSNLIKGLNGLSCTIFNFYLELMNGQTVEKTPKWNGVSRIGDTLNEVKDTVNQIVQDKNQIFSGQTTFQTQKVNFKSELGIKYNDINNLVITYTPNFTPNYVTNYGPYTTVGTSLYTIKQEFDKKIDTAEKLLTDSERSANGIVNTASSITNLVDSTNSILNDFSSTLDSFSTSIIEPWMSYQELITSYGTLFCNCFFGALLGLGAIEIALLVLFVFLKLKITKLFIIIIWNLFTFVMILSFLIGGIFGIIGIIGIDAPSVMYYIISSDNLASATPRVIPSSIKSKINTCLYGSGDLSSEFDKDGLDDINKLNEMKTKLQSIKADLSSNKDSNMIKLLNEDLDLKNINFETIDNTVISLISSLNGITNSGNVWGTTTLSDYWVTEQSKCLPNPPSGGNTYAQCFVFSNLATDKAKYQTLSCSTEKGNIDTYLTQIHQIKADNSAHINTIKSANSALNDRFRDTIDTLIQTLDDINDKLITPINNIVGSINGDANTNFISSLVNCSFLGGHLRMIYENLYDGLGINFYTFGIIMEVISSATGLGICFLIPVINRFNKTFPEDKETSIIKGFKQLDNELPQSERELIHKQDNIVKYRKRLEKGQIVIKNVD